MLARIWATVKAIWAKIGNYKWHPVLVFIGLLLALINHIAGIICIIVVAGVAVLCYFKTTE